MRRLCCSDVADVVDDTENIRQAAWMNTTPAVIVNIQRQPGANIIEVVDRVKQLLPAAQGTLPPAIDVLDADRPHDHHSASVEDVEFELVLPSCWW